MKLKKTLLILLHITTIILLLSGCSNNATPQPESTSTSVMDATLEPTDSFTPETTQTQEVPRRFFIHTSNFDIYFPNMSFYEQLKTSISELGYEVISSETFQAQDQPFDYALLFSPTEELISEFNSNNVEHLLIVSENLEVSSDIPTTVFDMSPADRIFIAGYLSAIISEDWRVGGLLPQTILNNTNSQQIFQNGVEFFCGRCSPVYGPIVNFPVIATISNPENIDATLQAFGEINTNKINTLFIPSSYLYDDFVILLQQNKITVVSDSMLDSDRSDWVDYAVVDNLNNLILETITTGNSPSNVEIIPVEFTISTSGDELSIGKANFISKTLQELKENFISPYSVIEE